MNTKTPTDNKPILVPHFEIRVNGARASFKDDFYGLIVNIYVHMARSMTYQPMA